MFPCRGRRLRTLLSFQGVRRVTGLALGNHVLTIGQTGQDAPEEGAGITVDFAVVDDALVSAESLRWSSGFADAEPGSLFGSTTSTIATASSATSQSSSMSISASNPSCRAGGRLSAACRQADPHALSCSVKRCADERERPVILVCRALVARG